MKRFLEFIIEARVSQASQKAKAWFYWGWSRILGR